ncbi:MAG: MarR family transcriptional regulator [Rhodocyclales bacterium]|nr:MarR family transcriptional regulator [Rhodocyclales bacterium]
MLRELARCYQAFEAYSGSHIRGLDLTPAQFDIVATLGNTPGMSFKELGEKTLITKGTLTGVVDRLEAQRLVRRSASPEDGRSMIVSLTPAGARLFESVFPAHLDHLRLALGGLDAARLQRYEAALRELRAAFESAPAAEPAAAAGGRSKTRRPKK